MKHRQSVLIAEEEDDEEEEDQTNVWDTQSE